MLNTNSSKPLYDQLKQLIKNDIISGVYRPGERMPSEAESALWLAACEQL